MGTNAAITAVAKHTPDRVVTTRDIAAAWQQSEMADAFIEMLGVEERRVACPAETGTTLAASAAWNALAQVDVEPAAIDMVITARSDRPHDLEASAAELCEALGATRAKTFEIKLNCRGFLDGLRIAQGLIDARRAEKVLVAAGTKQTLALGDVLRGQLPSLPFQLEDAARGDAGAAVLVERKPEGSGIRIKSAKSIEGDAGELDAGHASTARRTITCLASLIRDTLIDNDWAPELVKWIVGPQVSANFTRLILERAGVPGERGIHSLMKFGNTSVASIPLTLSQVLENPSWTKGQGLLGAAAPGYGAVVLGVELS